jgi:hypothetical protein
LIVNETKTIWPDSITNGLIRFVINSNYKQDCILYSDKAPLWFSDTSLDNFINSKTGFTILDSSVVRKQLNYNKKFEFQIDTLNFRKIQFLSYDTLASWGLGTKKNSQFWETYSQRVHRCFCMIYCPIYNNNKTLAIIPYSHLCGGLWIEWYEILYKRNGTTWKIADTISQGGS